MILTKLVSVAEQMVVQLDHQQETVNRFETIKDGTDADPESDTMITGESTCESTTNAEPTRDRPRASRCDGYRNEFHRMLPEGSTRPLEVRRNSHYHRIQTIARLLVRLGTHNSTHYSRAHTHRRAS
jgi:hypothetical protein